MEHWLIIGFNQEKINIAREIELGTRVVVHSHLENHMPKDGIPWQEMHIEELVKEGQRRVEFERSN